MLNDWLIERYGIDLGARAACGGAALADALADALGAAGFVVDEQAPLLVEASRHAPDVDFAEACLDRARRIIALQDARRDVMARFAAKCQNGVPRKGSPPPPTGPVVKRFLPLWPLTDQSADIVNDMLVRLAAEGYLPHAADALRDLRQGLGYYRRGEDPWRERRPVVWLGGLNALHHWILLLLDDDHRLVAPPKGDRYKWDTAAALLLDRDGHPLTAARIHHGVVTPDEQQRLSRCVPLPTPAVLR